jgi:Aspartyl protease
VALVDCIHDRGQFFVPLSLNGSAPHYFILDTGAGVSAVDAALALALRLPTVAHTELATTAGVMTVEQVRIAKSSPLRRGRPVEGLSWYGLTPTTQDLSTFSIPIPDGHEAGLLGNDYLQNFVIQLQFAPATLEIARPSGYVPAGVDPARFIPFVLDQNTIVRVQGRLDGWLNVDLRLDTGSATMTVAGPYLNVTAAMWQALRARHPEYQLHDRLEVHGIFGKLHLDVGTITCLEVGPLRFDGIKVVVQPPVGYFASANAVGFIALNLFATGGWLTLDYPAGRIYI